MKRRLTAALALVFALAGMLPALAAGGLEYLGGEYAAVPSKAAGLACADEAEQIVLVEYRGGSDATVSFHEKIDGEWVQIYDTYGYVGRNGIDKVRAGDKRTPTGTYNLTTPFGILDDPGSVMPYTKLTPYHYWCGSSRSGYYNQFCDSRVNGRKGQKGDEILINYTGFYNYCLFIDYNAAGVPGKGSCIFLHCIGTRSYTAGCVAIPEEIMREVLIWARPGVKIVIGRQLPAESMEPHPLATPAPASTVLPASGWFADSPDVPDTPSGDLPEVRDVPINEATAPTQDGGLAFTTVRAAQDAPVRTGPGEKYLQLTTLLAGETAPYMEIIAQDDRGVAWYCVMINGSACWLSSENVELLAE